MQPLYPPIKTYAKHEIKVDDLHTLYIEESGNPDGLPVVVLHSGPGAGCESCQRQFFDPERYRIILFDQRGSGRSKPKAELRQNTTEHLIADIEKIRTHLGISRWIVFGGAWGAALALLYAQAYPTAVQGLIVHSVFLAREQDINWFYQRGANAIFPDYWQDFTSGFSDRESTNLISAYHRRLTGEDELAKMAAAKSWSLWQARAGSLQPHNSIIDHFAEPHVAICLARIESHYFSNHCFIKENQILDNINKLKDIPGFIIHGRYNIICPLAGAWALNQAWPTSDLYIVRDAGHSLREPGIIDAIILTTQKIHKELNA